MNIFNNVKRKDSNSWREPSAVVDLTEDSDGEEERAYVPDADSSASDLNDSIEKTHRRGKVMIIPDSDESADEEQENTPNADTDDLINDNGDDSLIPETEEASNDNPQISQDSEASNDDLQISQDSQHSSFLNSSRSPSAPQQAAKFMTPPTQASFVKTSSSVNQIGSYAGAIKKERFSPLYNVPVIPTKQQSPPTYTKKEENDAEKRASLTQTILTKKDQLKRLEKFGNNEGYLSLLPDKGAKVNSQITSLRLELRKLYKSLKEMGEISPLREKKVEPPIAAESNIVPFENLPVKKAYHRPGDYAVAEALTGDALIQLHSTLREMPEDASDDGPRGLEVELLPHQKRALAWALWRECKHPKGGILADDMGLGKTLTMIALILRSRELIKDNEENITASPGGLKKAKTLVVCPASVLKQWEAEIVQRCKPRALVPYVYHGNSRGISLNRLCRADVVITSFAIVGREGKITTDFIPGDETKPSGTLFQVRWERIILDEAHTIRNPKTQIAQGAYQLEGKYRWCLTGTPLHNKLKDIYSLLYFLKFTPFTNEMVWRRVAENKSSVGLERLNTLMKTIMLRRTKAELHEMGQLDCLPSKGVHQVELVLSEEENKIYQHMLKKSKTLMAKFILQRAERMVESGEDMYAVKKAMEQLEKDGFDVKKGMFMDGQNVKSSHILVLLLRLRQICCHMSLVKDKLDDDIMEAENIDVKENSFDDLVNDINNLSIAGRDKPEEKDLLDSEDPIYEEDFQSTKIKATVKLVEEIREREEKVVIVSQWKSFLTIVKYHLRAAGFRSTLFSGDLTMAKRQEIISDFNEKHGRIKVLLLSLTAGGTGVNLIGGNNLILMDIHWNPQLEAQAMDRIYRVGQKKDVNIYKLICQQSIESSIEIMQEKKLELSEGVLNKKKSVKLDIEDLRDLFKNA
ncbi:Hypothetical predicted protein [Cloeon dipterum]|uniref:Helicase ATP-binding domain-containing protein n=1 Tax=Cloeon dipterum TaxID=197152 RepID=A0A8S1BWF7_9INSE|nr:Hypothetical predicted protein [Cloeon dipterum]